MKITRKPILTGGGAIVLNADTVRLIHGDCFNYMKSMISKQEYVDLILTSPFYNTNKKSGKTGLLTEHNRPGVYLHFRYDLHTDSMTSEEYADFTEELFEHFDSVLHKDGCVLYNISYGNENTTDWIMAINRIILSTCFTIADCIIWKKKIAAPNNMSTNRLTRITEFVFVLCCKKEQMTFKSNKQVVSVRENPWRQNIYENIPNFVEAANNDEPCDLNKATFSSELMEKLLKIYAPPGSVVLDPFSGTGTTAIGCIKAGCMCIGVELSEAQSLYAKDRVERTLESVRRSL